MKLKGMRTIALLLAAVFLIGGSVAGTAAAGTEDKSSDYWWEDSSLDCLTPHERKQVRDIMILVMDRYFGIDVSRMSFEEMDEVGRSIGPEGLERARRLFEDYAQKKGFEVPEPLRPEPPLPPPAEVEDPYWWEIAANPEESVEGIIDQIAEAKGMSPDEVRTSFGELFPGVDLWNMTFYEFHHFVNSLPRPPLRPVCFEELRQSPYIIAVFGRVPALSTERELTEFNEKLNKVIDEVCPLLCKLPRCEFPLGTIGAFRGAISISVRSDQLGRAEEVYEIIAEKAESLFGIEDVPVVFSNAMDDGPAGGGPPSRGPAGGGPQSRLASRPSPYSGASSGWRPPFNEPFPRIPGAV